MQMAQNVKKSTDLAVHKKKSPIRKAESYTEKYLYQMTKGKRNSS
jgi:hypothetical protein